MLKVDEIGELLDFDKNETVTIGYAKVIAATDTTLTVNYQGETISAARYCTAVPGDVVVIAVNKGKMIAIASKNNGGGGGGDYLPITGGTISGALTVDGVLDAAGGIKDANSDATVIRPAWAGNSLTDASYLIGGKNNGDGTVTWKDVTAARVAEIALNGTDQLIKVSRGASMASNTYGYWAAMCKSDSTGSPVLPTAKEWWHVLSMDWNNASNAWVSQLALPVHTQEGTTNDALWFRHNTTNGTEINASVWKKAKGIVAEGESGIWHYIKYADKTYELFGHQSWTATTATGMLGIPSTAYPFTIDNSKKHMCNVTGGVTSTTTARVSYVNMNADKIDAYIYKETTGSYVRWAYYYAWGYYK